MLIMFGKYCCLLQQSLVIAADSTARNEQVFKPLLGLDSGDIHTYHVALIALLK